MRHAGSFSLCSIASSRSNGRVRLVVRDYPLPQHTNAFKAAEAAEAAREQNKYWEYAAKLFSNQSALEVESSSSTRPISRSIG